MSLYNLRLIINKWILGCCMNKNDFFSVIFFAVITILSTSVHAGTVEVYANDLVSGDSQSFITSSGTVAASISNLEGSSSASGTSDGYSAVSASAESAWGSYDISANTFYRTSFTNTAAFATDFTSNFLINGPAVSVFGNASYTSALGAQAKANVYMYSDSGLTDKVTLFLELANYGSGLELLHSGAGINDYNIGGSTGYIMDSYSGSFSGVLAAGETVTFDSRMFAAVWGDGLENGAKAFIGDPNDLSTTPGFGGEFTMASVSTVPVPAAAWLFGTGLIGLFGISRRKKV